MGWNKKGWIYAPPTDNPEMSGWTSYPTALLLDDRIRIFHAPRNRDNQTCIAYVDLDRAAPEKVIAEAKRPVLERGALGTFDDCGVQPIQALWVDDEVYLYYLGWNPAINKLSRNSTGLAVSHDGGDSFVRAFEGPVLDRTRGEPYFSFTPWIIRDGDDWRMWYATGTAWTMVNDKPEGAFELRDAVSDDGIEWRRPNRQILPPTRPDEVMCKPNVVLRDGTHHMWFSYRSYLDFRGGDGSYRIGYAHSEDGETWRRDDPAGGLDVGAEGSWDSDMVCFSSILEVDDRLYMFYNGNGFGQTGFGYAEWNFSG
jgi:hypothetical protein